MKTCQALKKALDCPWTRKRWLKAAAIVLGVIALIVLVLVFQSAIGDFLAPGGELSAFIDELGSPAAQFLFAGVYIVAVVCFAPASILTILGGYLFGFLVGLVTALLAATVGATIAFVLGRWLCRARVERTVERNEFFARVDHLMKAKPSKAIWLVALLRLTPVVPFNLLNYGLGAATPISLAYYTLISCVSMLPGTAGYVFIGVIAAEAASDAANDQASLVRILLLFVLAPIATCALLIFISVAAKRILKKMVEEEEEEEEEGKKRKRRRRRRKTKASLAY